MFAMLTVRDLFLLRDVSATARDRLLALLVEAGTVRRRADRRWQLLLARTMAGWRRALEAGRREKVNQSHTH